MKIFGISFVIATALSAACLCEEPSFEGQDTKSSEQIIFEIDGVNAAMHNSCPDEDQHDSCEQDIDKSYEDEDRADNELLEDDSLSYDFINYVNEEDDESDLEDDNQIPSAQSIKTYTAQRATEKTGVDFAESDLEENFRTNVASDVEEERVQTGEETQKEELQQAHSLREKINEQQGFVINEKNQTCPPQENSAVLSTPAAYCTYPYDLMDYMQMGVLRIQQFLLSLFHCKRS